MGIIIKETDLYLPIKLFFEDLGYTVHAEVKNCDIALYKDGRLTVIEMKKSFTLNLLYQAIERQKPGDEVFVAIPRPVKSSGKTYKSMLALIKKLDLGLITVALDSPVKTVEILVFPRLSTETKKSIRYQRKKTAVINELSARTHDLNLGGSTKRKLMTAYREKVIKIACALAQNGAAKASGLIKKYGCDKNTYNILYRNLYGWFSKTSNGMYVINDKGYAALADEAIAPVVSYYQEQIKAMCALGASTSTVSTNGHIGLKL
jgi:hypothetical protein